MSNYFNNSFKKIDDVYVYSKSDDYAKNFGKQWIKYRNIQIDSINGFNHSREMLLELCFNQSDIFKDKEVLEIGCGAGRFTEIILEDCKKCVSLDLSESIFHNVEKKNNKLELIKANFLKLNCKSKFDIVFCRGVLQHTQDPLISILKLHEFIKPNGLVIYDIYKYPRIGLLHPKYLIWRRLLKYIFSYDQFEKYLIKNITILLNIKRIIKKIFLGSDLISDLFIPVWDYKGKLNLNSIQLKDWAILDTLDGIFAYYDKPQKYKKVINFLKQNNLKLINSNEDKNIFISTIKY